jgi:hypothetical protein
MDARHDDLIHTIVQALMDARCAPPRRRRAAWHEGHDEDLQQARRDAVAILDALQGDGLSHLAHPARATASHALRARRRLRQNAPCAGVRPAWFPGGPPTCSWLAPFPLSL